MEFDVTFGKHALDLPAGHYFFVPQVGLSAQGARRRPFPLALGPQADRAAGDALPRGHHGPAKLDAGRPAAGPGLAPHRHRHHRAAPRRRPSTPASNSPAKSSSPVLTSLPQTRTPRGLSTTGYRSPLSDNSPRGTPSPGTQQKRPRHSSQVPRHFASRVPWPRAITDDCNDLFHRLTYLDRHPGLDPTVTLVANSIPYSRGRLQRGESRAAGPANGLPAHQSSSRTTLIAAAVRTCCRWAFACPMYRHRLNPQRRIACSCVPSMPARAAYRDRNSSVPCSPPGRLQRLVLLTRQQPDDPRLLLRPRALRPRRTRRAILAGEPRLEGHGEVEANEVEARPEIWKYGEAA